MNASPSDSLAANHLSANAPSLDDGPLTQSQREFARIVGKALAEEWRRQTVRGVVDHATANQQPPD